MANYSTLLGFQPNQDQSMALDSIFSFIASAKDVFVLKGSAGTGKTTIVKAVTNYLAKKEIEFQIGAPTGRAAKVIGTKTSQVARTMHSQIYTPETTDDGGVRFLRNENQSDAFTVYLVDEASMVSSIIGTNNTFCVSKPLLFEYIDYVKQGNKNNKIIFIGDRFQLSPIQENLSCALSIPYLKKNFHLDCDSFELTKVMRQADGSDILNTATDIRNLMNRNINRAPVSIHEEKRATNALVKYISKFDPNRQDKLIAICSSNNDVRYWNNAIRHRLGLASHPISVGDFVITQSPWMDNQGNWVFKSEYGKVKSVESGLEQFANLHFLNIRVEFPTNAGGVKTIETKMLLESLATDHGILTKKQESHLFAEVMKRNKAFRKSKNKADDKYLGALRLKHAYATTCHKAQGGEWEEVLIHPWMIGRDLRWTYTAITRAKQEVFSYAA